ncbi:Gliding motility-associated, C-terminal domain [Flavobacteriaceae bacterium]
MKIYTHFYILILLVLTPYTICNAKNTNNVPPKKGFTTSFLKQKRKADFLANVAPIVTATDNQTYCPLTSVNIATTINIIDPDDTSTDAIYIQISSGYINGQDQLSLNNAILHPTITSSWNASEGKLTLKSPTNGTAVTYTDFVSAIKDVQFSNSSTNPSGTRNFSISIGQANYLPRNGHYYEYVPNLGITWTDAKSAADIKTYYGLKGYLATITAADEAQLAGKQAPGAGWIGGSDAETENVWKWITGPEAGTVFWNGTSNGSSPNFAFWNSNEPNQAGDEDYAHITAPGVGIAGSWNDLSNTGDLSGDYQPKGYIVEYGGTPGDPVLQLSASTTLTIASITSTLPASRCDSGTVTLQASATAGIINWYDELTGGTNLGNGTSFTTPSINNTKIYYVETATASCSSSRTAVEAKINITPTITSTNSPSTNCGPGLFTLNATPTEGNINWYSQIGGSIVGTGLSYTTPTIPTNTTYYAEAVNSGCINNTKTPIDLIVYPLPIVTDQTIAKCVSKTITLDAGIPNMTYLWSTGAVTQTIDVVAKGIFTVNVTSPAPQNCTSKKTITVLENNKPEIKNINVNETTVSIELIQKEDYFEFSIDGINYQNSNVFTNAPSGLQTAYVRDINKCSDDKKTFIVIIVPKYFTPNNDGYNDVWEIKGLVNYPLAEVTLFDRYGKIITHLDSYFRSWDGTFNKNPLPATDYWYVLKLDKDIPEVKGHFSLKR